MRLVALALMVGLAAGPSLAQTPYAPTVLPAPGETICPGGLCQPEVLTPLFEALRATETGYRGTPVHILQIGDSHTAGDRITGKLRADLQARFGNAGRGVLPAGIPYTGYAPYQVEVTEDGWVSDIAPLVASGEIAPAFGLAAVRGKATVDSQLNLRFEHGSEPHVFGVCGWRRGPESALAIEAEGRLWHLSPREGADCLGVAFDSPVAAVRLRGVGAGMVLDALWSDRGTHGVIVSNLGVIGSTLADFASRDETMMGRQLRYFSSHLIILAYGTNEGFDDSLDAAAYERLLRDQIARIRRMTPGVPILILGAPDALRSGEPGGCSADGRRRPPPNLAVVRDVQRRVAAEMGVAFWDWRGRMGGDCSADRLATMTEPLMRGDRVHFTSEGADWIGGMLSHDLMTAYDAWKARAE